MKKATILILFWSIVLGAETLKLNFVVSRQANFMHILDGMSKWDSHVNRTYLDLYKKHFTLSEVDRIELKNYAVVRDSLGWGEETKLFKWADKSFSLDSIPADKKERYAVLKKTVSHFQSKPDFVNFLNDRFAELPVEMIKTRAEKYVADNLTKVDSYLSIWREDSNYSRDVAALPVYIFYAPIAGSKHGGANGNGIFAEFTTKAEEISDDDYDTLLHEVIHKLTSIPENLQIFLTDSKNYSAAFDRYFKDTNLKQADLVKVFSDTDPLTWDKPESGMLDEIFVHYCAPVVTTGYTDEQIIAEAKRFRSKNWIEYARIWEAQTLLKKELNAMADNNLSKQEKIWSLIRGFYDKVYYNNKK